jgi:hypothetical protein
MIIRRRFAPASSTYAGILGDAASKKAVMADPVRGGAG